MPTLRVACVSLPAAEGEPAVLHQGGQNCTWYVMGGVVQSFQSGSESTAKALEGIPCCQLHESMTGQLLTQQNHGEIVLERQAWLDCHQTRQAQAAAELPLPVLALHAGAHEKELQMACGRVGHILNLSACS